MINVISTSEGIQLCMPLNIAALHLRPRQTLKMMAEVRHNAWLGVFYCILIDDVVKAKKIDSGEITFMDFPWLYIVANSEYDYGVEPYTNSIYQASSIVDVVAKTDTPRVLTNINQLKSKEMQYDIFCISRFLQAHHDIFARIYFNFDELDYSLISVKLHHTLGLPWLRLDVLRIEQKIREARNSFCFDLYGPIEVTMLKRGEELVLLLLTRLRCFSW